MRRLLPLVAVAALAVAAPAAAFAPADALVSKQWYLQQDHAFDAWAEPPTTLAPVKIAIVDSGVDCSLPDFQGRIADKRSFVGGDPCVDAEGHGTFIAGIIAANLDTQGIAGIAYTSQLLVAKVVRSDGTIPLDAEAAAIRWAADSGARVINLSLGGVRDPMDPTATRSRNARPTRSRMRTRRARCSSRPSATATRRSRSRGPSRAIRPRCRTCSASARSRSRGTFPTTRTATRSSTTSLRRGRDLLDVSARADRAAAVLHRPGLLRLRFGRLPRTRRNVVRRAAGDGSGRSAVRARADADERAGLDDPRALGRRRQRDERLPEVRAAPRPVQRLGPPRRRTRGRCARRRRCRRPTARAERRRGHGRVHALGQAVRRARRRSTTTTTRSTSTASRSRRTSA